MIDTRGFDELTKKFDNIISGASQKRREIHDKIGEQLKKEVDSQIDSRINDSHGKIRSWQKQYVGSRGGYTAVRPRPGKDSHGYAYGYITNALENGHRVRISKNPKYRSKSKRFKVQGYKFYEASKSAAKRLGLEGAEELENWIKSKMEGTG